MRRRAEREAARQARKAEEDRRENAMVDIRKKNAAVIAAANAAKGTALYFILIFNFTRHSVYYLDTSSTPEVS